MDARNPLIKSSHNVLISGVCGGIAEWVGWDATLVRVIYVLLTLCTAAFPGVLIYIILWLIMPRGK